MLAAGLIDMAVMPTEDAVAYAAEGNPLRLYATFVASPRAWGVYVNNGSSARCAADLRGHSFGMPDEKAAVLALSVLGEQANWCKALRYPRRPFNQIQHAADAMSKGLTHATVWERHAARSWVAAGKWDLLAQATLPWPSLVFVASREALYSKAGAMRQFLSFARAACDDFKAGGLIEAAEFTAKHYGLSLEEASHLISETVWLCEREVDPRIVELPLQHLIQAGCLDAGRTYDPWRFVAREMGGLVGQIGALAAHYGGAPGVQEDDIGGREDEDPGAQRDLAPVAALPALSSAAPALVQPQDRAAAGDACEDDPPVPAG